MAFIGTETIGLDVGRTAIKAVRLRRTWNGHESIAYFSRHMSSLDTGNGEAEQIRSAPDSRCVSLLRDFMHGQGWDRSTFFSALPCGDIFFRQLTLPFHDHARLSKILPFEVENLVPLPLEEIRLEYHLFKRNKAAPLPIANVLVAATPKRCIREHLQLLSEAGIGPAAVDADGLALFSYFEYHRRYARLPENVMIIDVGASKTTLCLTVGGRPFLLRAIPWGTECITEAIIKRYGLSSAEAENRKQEMSVRQISPSLHMLIHELRVTLHSYECITKTRLQHAALCGGGARLIGLREYLGEVLQLEFLSRAGSFSLKCPPEYAVAFGLAIRPRLPRLPWHLLRGNPRPITVCVDFHRKEGHPSAAHERTKRDLYVHAIGLLMISILMFVDLSVHLRLAEARVQELKTAIRSQFEEAFSRNASGLDELDAAGRALESVKMGLARLGGNRPSMLGALAGLTNKIPPRVLLKITMLTVEAENIILEAEVGSFEAVEHVRQGLATLRGVQDVRISDARMGELPNQVSFRVTVTMMKT